MTLRIIPVTIPSGSAMSAGVDCSGSVRIVRIVMPSAWDYATLTFQMSPDGVNYHDLYHITPGVTDPLKPYPVALAPVTPNAVVAFPVNTGASVAWVKLRSGTTATPVKQAADRVFQIVVEDADAATGGDGAAGPAGPTGPAGTMGAQGAVGATGPTGIKGATGTSGVTGPAGGAGGQGVTDGSNAAAGAIGEVLSASIPTGQPLTTNVVLNLGSINLTPGDWNIGSVVNFTPNNTGPNGIAAGITLSSGTMPTDLECATGVGIMNQNWTSGMQSNKIQTMPTSLLRVNTATAKTVYLVAMANFGGGSVTVTGYMSARRIR